VSAPAATGQPGRTAVLEIDGARHRFAIEIEDAAVEVSHQGRSVRFRRPDGRTHLGAAKSDGEIVAPMPGLVTVIHTTVGSQVGIGDVLGVLEAMKMEHALVSPVDGLVTRIAVDLGDQVTVGQALFTIAAGDSALIDRATAAPDNALGQA
jgi:acetyl-CoA/propionyl-CoA carboxylase biotin carboxyl carrier protein